MEYRCKIDDRIIFDYEQLIWANEKEIVFSETDLTPTSDENHNLILSRVKFNVLSTIFPSANPLEVIQGWNHLSDYLGLDEASRLDRMTEIFVTEYLNKLNT